MFTERNGSTKLTLWFFAFVLATVLAASGCSDTGTNPTADASTSDGTTSDGTTSDGSVADDGTVDDDQTVTGDATVSDASDVDAASIIPCTLDGGGTGIQCDETCVNAQTDNKNCGGCGKAVGPGAVCFNGVRRTSCSVGDDEMRAFRSDTLCDGTCVDINTSTQHCGACDAGCDLGEVCINGSCECPIDASEFDVDGYPLPDDSDGRFRDCSTNDTPLCVDGWTTASSCGACGTECSGGTLLCRTRLSEEDPPDCVSQCDEDLTECNGGCVDTTTDPFNCGSCGNVCGSGRTCNEGNCNCAEGAEECGGACVIIGDDEANCGGCVADSKGQVCAAGTVCGLNETETQIECHCPGTTQDCGSGCTNVETDNANCGECGEECENNQRCMGGTCGCPKGFASCNDLCVDVNSDPFNCGGCDNACESSQRCFDGTCQDIDACPGDTSTKALAETSTECSITRTTSEGSPTLTGCVDTASDINHCGACNTACGPSEICGEDILGKPACICSDGLSKCGDTCVDLNNDPNHCGGCDQDCTDGQVCVTDGESLTQCQDSCHKGRTLCNGRCVDTETDNDNCGVCGNACTNTGAEAQQCVEGECADVVFANECVGEGSWSWCFGECANTQAEGTVEAPNLNCGICGNPCSKTQICQPDPENVGEYICNTRNDG